MDATKEYVMNELTCYRCGDDLNINGGIFCLSCYNNKMEGIADLKDEVRKAQDKLSRRNMQIKDLKGKVDTAKQCIKSLGAQLKKYHEPAWQIKQTLEDLNA